MTAWVILIGFGVAVVGVIVRVGWDLAGDLRGDREAHGGRLTTTAARRALWIGGAVAILVLILIVWPLVLSDT
jgi:hypothetical protein